MLFISLFKFFDRFVEFIVRNAKIRLYFYIASDILKKVEKILTKVGYDEDDPVYFINDLLILGELVFFSQFGLFLHELDNWTHLEGNPTDYTKQEASQKDLLFQRFIALLSRPSNTEREVRAYAEQLLVTPKYLSAVCKEKSGSTAMDWITESMVAQIKYYLLQTDLTVKEIAFKLDFPDVSFFCKYVKKHLGQAPLEYRNAQLLSKV